MHDIDVILIVFITAENMLHCRGNFGLTLAQNIASNSEMKNSRERRNLGLKKTEMCS